MKERKVKTAKVVKKKKDLVEVEKEIEVKTESKPIERKKEQEGIVVLVSCASLSRGGKRYLKDRPFQVVGEKKLKYFELDRRFQVTRKK